MSRRWAWLLSIALASVAPTLAHAQTAPSGTGDASELETEARARFQLGQLYYSQARFAEAAREFEAAYATHPHPLLLHNIYLARRDLGDIPGAVDALTRYLAVATDLSTGDRRLLEGRLATMQRQLPTASETTTTTTVTPTEPSDPVVGDAPGDTTSELATPDPTELPDETDTPPPDPTPPPASSGGMGIVPGVAIVSVGGAALIGAAIAGGVALGVQSDRDGQCTLPGGACPASLDQSDYASRFAAARDAAWGLFIVGAATAAIGGVLLGVGASETSDARTPSVSAACDATGCVGTLSGHF